MPTTATQIVDGDGNVWTIGANAAILRNGIVTQGVGTKILFSGGNIYVYGTDDNWWQWDGGGWTSATNIARSAVSSDGTTVPPAAQVVDSAGAVWTISADAAILRNGVQTAGFGTTIAWTSSTIYVFGTDSKWWKWTGSGWMAGAPPPTTSTPPPAIVSSGGTVSSDGTTVPTNATQIVDNAGAVWTIGAGSAILRDGAPTTGYGTTIAWTGGTIYVFGTDAKWWRWTGWEWVSTTSPALSESVSSAAVQPAPATPQPTPATPQPATAILSGALDAPETSTAPAGYLARIVAPANQMHFTAGLPLRFFADIVDANEWQCPPGNPPYNCPDIRVAWFDNGSWIGTISADIANEDLWELTLPNGLPAGDHRITCVYTPTNPPSFTSGAPISCNAPGVLIHVDPPPPHSKMLPLGSDLILSGATDFDLSDTTVIGNGFRIVSAPGYSGNVAMTNAFLADVGRAGYGIDITTSGSVTIDHVIHEASAPVRIASSGTLTVTNNEFRENDLVTYAPTSDPDVAVLLVLAANSAASRFEGNNVGGGVTHLNGSGRWQVGGLTADRGNVIIGPRGVLAIDSPGAVIQGNYLHHEYPTRWSQGFNLITGAGLPGLLAEHNVIRKASWTVQNFCGEFRYNLIVDEGQHNSWRTSCSGTSIHHNLFTHTGDHGTGDSGILWFYQGESGIAFYNNTLNGGGIYDKPVLRLDNAASLSSYRNNVATAFTGSGPLVASGVAGVIASADYNAWSVGGAQRYGTGVVVGSPGQHDTGSATFAAADDSVYRIDEGLLWLRQSSAFDVLRYYRSLFTPASGSGLVDSGDPADGAGVDRGAVGTGIADPNDNFGTF